LSTNKAGFGLGSNLVCIGISFSHYPQYLLLDASMKRSQSFQSFLHASPPSSLKDSDHPLTDPSILLQDSILSPPFYGRPYRLPPSPSFTELLKPQWRYPNSFSRTHSRDSPISVATTPESSDDESTIAKASKFAQSHSGKNDVGAVGTNEFYGFALYLGSSIAFRATLFF
jgi:hypothetical protein